MLRTFPLIHPMLFVAAVAMAASSSASADAVKFTQKPTVAKSGGGVQIAFAVSDATDVEVAILNAKGGVVRHLAAGVVGAEAVPPAPLAAGLSQKLTWDGNDDYGRSAGGGPFRVRVRIGLGVKLDRIVGGNPYAYHSRQMGQGDHAAWRITGLEAKPDGTVYLLGNANLYGPPALRAYAADGTYQHTVYPPPAGKPVDAVKGWGVNVRADGTWTPQYGDLSSPALSRTLISGTRGRIATLIPSPGNDELLLEYNMRLMRVNTDGTIPPEPTLDGSLVNAPAPEGLTGQMKVAVSPDRKHFYVAGVFAAKSTGRRRTGAENAGPWRDGQVYKVDYATRTAEVVFALDADTIITDLGERGKSPIADAKYGNYAAIAGVAVDAAGRLFICDRQNKRIVIQGADGKVVREIPCTYPDSVAVDPKSKALFVTTRKGHYHDGGDLILLKFDDWSTSDAPSFTVRLCEVRHYSQPTYLAAVESKGQTYVWVAYTALPVRVYRNTDNGLELAKDFHQAGDQRALDLQHVAVDSKTGDIYLADGFGSCFRVDDWSEPTFKQLMIDEKTPARGITLAVDARNRWLYTRNDRAPVLRWKIDGGEFLSPAPVGDTGKNVCTPTLSNDWRIGLGRGDRGIAASPDGGLATLGALGRGPNYGGHLRYFNLGGKSPENGLLFKGFDNIRAGGVRFDPQGNLYVGKYDGRPKAAPKGFENDRNFHDSTGRIYKLAPTGSLAAGNLFPSEPEAPAKVYDVHYGAIGNQFSRTPRFGVDGYGRIYYPSSLLPQVSVIDNEGNAVVAFGTYGNRDSAGGLAGDKVPTPGVPMAWPSSVDADDEHIYVSDIVNIRLLRLAKTFAASEEAALD